MGSTGDSPPEKKVEEGEEKTCWQPRHAWAQLSLRPAGCSQWVPAPGDRVLPRKNRIFIASARWRCRALAQKRTKNFEAAAAGHQAGHRTLLSAGPCVTAQVMCLRSQLWFCPVPSSLFQESRRRPPGSEQPPKAAQLQAAKV